MAETVFECQMCGQCCHGRGGIVLAPSDLSRLAEFLKQNEADIISSYTEKSAGKLKIRPGSDGFCIFFRAGQGCAVHPAKPDVCRAWPFFRGNLTDPISLEMAKSYCPGIRPDATFAEFVTEGLASLKSWHIHADSTSPDAPNALKIAAIRPHTNGDH